MVVHMVLGRNMLALWLCFIVALHIARASPSMDPRIGATMVHMIEALGTAKRAPLLRHRDLVDVGRVHDGNRLSLIHI